jgi:membrane associated rhomboid family serine protease
MMSRKEKRAKAITDLKTELSKIGKGILNFKRVFLVYLLILIISVIIFSLSQSYPNIEKILSASRLTPWGIITSIFVHSSFSHLVLNMGSLFAFIFLFALCNSIFDFKVKRKIENFFLVSVFVFAVVSNILWIAFSLGGSIGASGLVYAVEGYLIGFSLGTSLKVLNYSKFKIQSLSTKYVILINIIISIFVIIQIFLDTQSFLGVGQGINIFEHGVSFLLGLFVSFFWFYIIKRFAFLN